MFQYAIGRSLADFYNVEFALDVSSFNNYELHPYSLNKLNISERIARESDVKRYLGTNTLVNRLLRKLPLQKWTRYRTEHQQFEYDKKIFQEDFQYLDGYWQNEKYFLSIRHLLLSDFKQRDNLSKNGREYRRLINLAKKSVSIHVRRGDYLTVDGIGVLDQRYYAKAVDLFVSILDCPTFFIFSDDIHWCKKNLHLEFEHVFIENTASEVEDLTLMSACKNNIIANSTFSWWAAWLNDYEHKRICAPKHWRMDIVNSSKIIPVNWHKL